jgi:hypothetical protein
MVLKGSGASAVAGGFKSLVPSPELMMMMTMIKMRLVLFLQLMMVDDGC